MANQDPTNSNKNRKYITAGLAIAALGAGALTLTSGGNSNKISDPIPPVPAETSNALTRLKLDGAAANVKRVQLDPSRATLENVAKDPFGQTTAQTVVEIKDKELWKNGSVIIARDTDGQLGAFLAKASENGEIDTTNSEAILLTDSSINAISVNGNEPESVDSLLLELQTSNPGGEAYQELVQEYVAAPQPRPVID